MYLSDVMKFEFEFPFHFTIENFQMNFFWLLSRITFGWSDIWYMWVSVSGEKKILKTRKLFLHQASFTEKADSIEITKLFWFIDEADHKKAIVASASKLIDCKARTYFSLFLLAAVFSLRVHFTRLLAFVVALVWPLPNLSHHHPSRQVFSRAKQKL